MKKLLAVAIILVQMISLVFAVVPAQDVADMLSSPKSLTVYTLSDLFTVVVDNTMMSLKEIAELAGLVDDGAVPRVPSDQNTPADKAAANPACMAQSARISVDMKGSTRVITRADTPPA